MQLPFMKNVHKMEYLSVYIILDDFLFYSYETVLRNSERETEYYLFTNHLFLNNNNEPCRGTFIK